MGACATKPKAVNGTAPEVASTEQTAAPAEATRDVEAVVVVSFFLILFTASIWFRLAASNKGNQLKYINVC
jgi:hypothetical protein